MRGEWYFTGTTQQLLASHLKGDVLLVGTPSLLEVSPHALLVDNSPWVPYRFDLQGVPHSTLPFEEFETTGRFETAALDPPWYFPTLISWVDKAATLTRRGGHVVFPLLGAGTRPTAHIDRTRLLGHCARIGTLEIFEDAVLYDTPLFEREALRAAGIEMHEAWRVADLIRLRVEYPPGRRRLKAPECAWREVRIGNQIVAVRELDRAQTFAHDVGLLARVPGTVGWVLDSVSRRDGRWQYINVCTTRNRVAATTDPLRLLGAAATLAGPTAAGATDDEEAHRLLQSWLST